MCKPRYRRLYKRTYSYWQAGIQVIWIVGGNQLKKQSAYWMKFSSLMAFSLQSYPQPLLIFFCRNKIIYEMCICHPFLQMSFSHILYIYQLIRLLLKCFFLSFLSGKKDWVKKWKKKELLPQNALPIWNYNYKSLLRLLYQFKCTPASFPSEIGVPLLLDLLFKQTHLYGKLFSI